MAVVVGHTAKASRVEQTKRVLNRPSTVDNRSRSVNLGRGEVACPMLEVQDVAVP